MAKMALSSEIDLVSCPSQYLTILRAGHPAWRRCSSLTYSRYARSSRLASRAPRSGRLSPYVGLGTLEREQRLFGLEWRRGILEVMDADAKQPHGTRRGLGTIEQRGRARGDVLSVARRGGLRVAARDRREIRVADLDRHGPTEQLLPFEPHG